MTSALPLEALVDPVSGIVRAVAPVEHPAGAPPRYTAMTAVEDMLQYAEQIKPFVADTTLILNEAIDDGKV
ncbi:hypothetical protein, partial [Streptomyces parvus]|uniref:hypothetical protein n=1 Tax=Streptomyces parvus TaxID=66428 RepID=UPI0033C63F58